MAGWARRAGRPRQDTSEVVADLLGRGRPVNGAAAIGAFAERLTALLEELSVRWLSGSLPVEHAHELMTVAIDIEPERLRGC